MLATVLALVVSATLDSTSLAIGDQTDLHLRATCEAGKQVQMPSFGNELILGIEILSRTPAQTTKLEDGRIQYDQSLTLTSFEDSLFSIPAIPFVCDSDTVWSKTLSLNILNPYKGTPDIIHDSLYTIYEAPVHEAEPQEKKDWKQILLWSLLGLAIAGGIGVGIYYFLVRRKKVVGKKKVVILPAEVIAMSKLDAIHAQKIWQKGQTKEYHTQLTDVIREYIANRYGISSAEQTSDETLSAIRPLLIEQKELYNQLQQILSLADLVKFAKWTATPNENEISLHNAYAFVKGTTPVVENDTEQNKRKSNRV